MPNPVPPSSPSKQTASYYVTAGVDVTDEQLHDCARLFSENYGVWGAEGPNPGKRVKLNTSRLKKQVLENPETTVLATCIVGDQLVGHAFATTWKYSGGVVGWITQLVVALQMRKRYIATMLLQQLKTDPLFDSSSVIGLASSHPAACNALAKIAHIHMGEIDTKFIANNARAILESTTVEYLKTAELRGSLFRDDRAPGVISSVFTNFYVDHEEPLAALKVHISSSKWKLGDLLDGHEFLIILAS